MLHLGWAGVGWGTNILWRYHLPVTTDLESQLGNGTADFTGRNAVEDKWDQVKYQHVTLSYSLCMLVPVEQNVLSETRFTPVRNVNFNSSSKQHDWSLGQLRNVIATWRVRFDPIRCQELESVMLCRKSNMACQVHLTCRYSHIFVGLGSSHSGSMFPLPTDLWKASCVWRWSVASQLGQPHHGFPPSSPELQGPWLPLVTKWY